MSRQTKEDIAELKKQYVKYFEDVPVQRYAAMYIGRNDDTIVLWKKNDPEFSEAVNQARANWVRKNALKAKAEFKLERLEKEIWKESIEQTVIMPTPIISLEDVQDNPR